MISLNKFKAAERICQLNYTVCVYENMRNETLATYIMYITHNVRYTTVDDTLIITAAIAVARNYMEQLQNYSDKFVSY